MDTRISEEYRGGKLIDQRRTLIMQKILEEALNDYFASHMCKETFYFSSKTNAAYFSQFSILYYIIPYICIYILLVSKPSFLSEDVIFYNSSIFKWILVWNQAYITSFYNLQWNFHTRIWKQNALSDFSQSFVNVKEIDGASTCFGSFTNHLRDLIISFISLVAV